jgi:hypothetical protein
VQRDLPAHAVNERPDDHLGQRQGLTAASSGSAGWCDRSGRSSRPARCRAWRACSPDLPDGAALYDSSLREPCRCSHGCSGTSRRPWASTGTNRNGPVARSRTPARWSRWWGPRCGRCARDRRAGRAGRGLRPASLHERRSSAPLVMRGGKGFTSPTGGRRVPLFRMTPPT